MDRYVAMLRTDADDRDITEWAMTETGNNIPVQFVADMNELEQLVPVRGEPSLILLNDPGAAHKGHERLAAIKADTRFAHIPVVILGEISTKEYIRACYRAGANSFIIKPSSIAATKEKVEMFFKYWFRVAEL